LFTKAKWGVLHWKTGFAKERIDFSVHHEVFFSVNKSGRFRLHVFTKQQISRGELHQKLLWLSKLSTEEPPKCKSCFFFTME